MHAHEYMEPMTINVHYVKVVQKMRLKIAYGGVIKKSHYS